MSSRVGFAIHNEFSTVRQRGGTWLLPGGSGKDLTNNSLFIGFDFIF